VTRPEPARTDAPRRLADLNACDRQAAVAALLGCCRSARWAGLMADARPFANLEELTATSDRICGSLAPVDWLEAFAGHPRIGQPPTEGAPAERSIAPEPPAVDPVGADWARHEQQGVRAASDAVRARLAEANRRYEARFGYIFIVCATGRSAEEMLAILEGRLANAPGAELAIAAEEQRKIARLRLAKLIGGGTTP
jgi:2-oxo-4-hydroxy-4-carboxy-5-ureidoimidazoline decarboxylase